MDHIDFEIGKIYFNTSTGRICKFVGGSNGIPIAMYFDCKPNPLDSQKFEHVESIENQKIILKSRLIGRP